MRRKPDGTESPYELNISYVSALDLPGGLPSDVHARRFLASQAVMVALRGVPGIYFHSLVGTANYEEGVEQTGHNRSINRRKFHRDELGQILADENSLQRQILDRYRRMLAARVAQPAFHPDADQRFVDTGHRSLVAFTRTSQDGTQAIHVVANVGQQPARVDWSVFGGSRPHRNLLGNNSAAGDVVEIGPWETVWLV
jgi:sucrose phosphorylase